MKELEKAGACGDLMLRFFDREGKECNSNVRSRVVGIPWESYKKIPNKVIVAAGEKKWTAILGLLKGNLVDTLIVDQRLAGSIYRAVG